MSTATWLSFLFAALAAFGNALANVMQRKAALEQQPGSEFGVKVLKSLLHNVTWILGFTGMVASFILQAVALSLGELSAVEVVITLEVPLTLLLASFVFKSRLGRMEWSSILVMTGGAIVLIGALNPKAGDPTRVDDLTYILAGGATAATIVALVAVSRRGRMGWRTATLGAAAGTSFGLTATMIKETVEELSSHGIVGILTTWQTYVAVGFGILGVVLVQWALHEGPLVLAQPGFTLMDPLVSILWGVLVFNEVTRTGWWLVLATVGAIGIGIGVALLARSPLLASVRNEEPGDAGRDAEALQPDEPALRSTR